MRAAAIRRLVLDASITLAWCFPDEVTPYTEELLDLLSTGAIAITPAIWPFEVSSALLIAERRGRTSVAHTSSMIQRIAALPITVEPVHVGRAFGETLVLARQEKLTEYDAAYLELSLRQSVPIATLDGELRRAARALGVELFAI